MRRRPVLHEQAERENALTHLDADRRRQTNMPHWPLLKKTRQFGQTGDPIVEMITAESQADLETALGHAKPGERST
jgi:hypothetical protein